MLIKVCGMARPGNIEAVGRLAPDMMGFIFYERSPRWAGGLDPKALAVLNAATRRVGVFVNADEEHILRTMEKYGLGAVQLHGDETPEMCARLKRRTKVIKAFGVAGREDVARTARYEGTCDYYLFDTLTRARGGSGRKFDHSLLELYDEGTPFIVSGGVGPEDASAILRLERAAGVDINSRFETAPGTKNTAEVGRFIQKIRNLKN